MVEVKILGTIENCYPIILSQLYPLASDEHILQDCNDVYQKGHMFPSYIMAMMIALRLPSHLDMHL